MLFVTLENASAKSHNKTAIGYILPLIIISTFHEVTTSQMSEIAFTIPTHHAPPTNMSNHSSSSNSISIITFSC